MVRRLALMFLPVLVGVPLLLVSGYQGTDLLNPIRTLWVAIQVSMRSAIASWPGWVQLLRQGADVANLWLLVMPAPLLILLSRSASLRHPGFNWEPHRTFLAIMALSGALLAAALVVPGSPAQDWDLMSLTVVPLALLALSRPEGLDPFHDLKPIRWGLFALALASSSAFILVNADAGAGLRRFKTLVGPTARLSTHERAYGNEKLMNFYTAEGERDSALVYARRALDADSTNIRYWTNVGLGFYRVGRYAEATPYLEEALRRDPERWTARYDLGLCYLNTERYAEAAENIAIAAQHGGDRPDVLHSLGIALFRSGRPDSALAIWQRVRARWPEYAAQLRGRSGIGAGARGVIDETPSPRISK